MFYPDDSKAHVADMVWGNYLYSVTPWDFENSIDDATQIGFRGRAWTLDGEMFESEITPLELYPYYVNLWLELAETPAAQVPENGFVKAKMRLGNDGSDTFGATNIDFVRYDPIEDVNYVDDTSELHGSGLTWLNEGTSQEFEVWVKPTKNELEAGKAQRKLAVALRPWKRYNGRHVYADTPKEDVIPYPDWSYDPEYITIEFEIPLLTPETEIEPEPAPTQEPVRDACVRKLEGHGDGVAEYTLTYCTTHEQLRESTRLALAIAGDEQEQVIQAAIGEWREVLDAEYEALLGQVGAEGKPAVEAERMAFNEWLEARQALILQARPGEKEEAGRCVLEILMHKVAEICYERHTAPNERGDILANADLAALEPGEAAWSCYVYTAQIPNGERTRETLCADHRDIERHVEALTVASAETDAEAWREVKQLWLAELDEQTNERWFVADEAERALIAAERQGFGEWLAAREALLNVLYPDQPAVVQEVLSQAIRARVLENCGD